MAPITNRQLRNVELTLEHLGKRGNFIAGTLVNGLIAQSSNRAKRAVLQALVAALYQMASSRALIIGKADPAHTKISDVEIRLLAESARQFAKAKNPIAMGLVQAMDKVPGQERTALIVGHGQVLLALTAIEMALSSERTPERVKLEIAPQLMPPITVVRVGT